MLKQAVDTGDLNSNPNFPTDYLYHSDKSLNFTGSKSHIYKRNMICWDISKTFLALKL